MDCRGGPVGTHHGDRGGGEEEEVVEVVLHRYVRVEVDDAEVLGLIEGEELRETRIPGESIYNGVRSVSSLSPEVSEPHWCPPLTPWDT